MAVANTNSSVSYNGNGAQTVFPTMFKFLAAGDLTVTTVTDGVTTTLELGEDYNVAGAGADEPGGTVTTEVAPANGTVLTITRSTPIVQPVVLAQSGPIPVKSLSGELDRLTLVCQELERRVAALEQLGNDLVNVSDIGNGVQFDHDFTTADPVESTFPFDIAIANGQDAVGLVARVEDDGDDPDFAGEAPSVQWQPSGAGNAITIVAISGLKPSNDYSITGLVLIGAG